MSQVWAETALGVGAADVMTSPARVGDELAFTLFYGLIIGRCRLFLLQPLLITFSRVNNDSDKDIRVLGAAEYRTITEINSSLVGLNPHCVGVCVYKQRFPIQLGE